MKHYFVKDVSLDGLCAYVTRKDDVVEVLDIDHIIFASRDKSLDITEIFYPKPDDLVFFSNRAFNDPGMLCIVSRLMGMDSFYTAQLAGFYFEWVNIKYLKEISKVRYGGGFVFGPPGKKECRINISRMFLDENLVLLEDLRSEWELFHEPRIEIVTGV